MNNLTTSLGTTITNTFKERRWSFWVIVSALGVLLISITESFAKPATDELASSGSWQTALAYSVPIMLAGLGGLFAERAGIVNIGLEGMMILGTWFGAWGALEFGPWGGLLIGGLGGALGGLLHAVATVSFGIDHIISGVAINLMAPGITRYLSSQVFANRPGGGITQSPSVDSVQSFDIPFLTGEFGTPNILGRIESWDWFWISDVSGILRGFLENLSWATVAAYLIVPLTIWILWKTSFGLRVRSCGEHPVAADSLGVNVYKYKYYATTISGFLAGLGGAFLVIELTSIYRENQTGGRGFIGLSTLIFGNWKPVGTALGSLLFGFTEVLRLRDSSAVHGLLLTISIGLLVLTIFAFFRYWKLGFTNTKGLYKFVGLLAGAAIMFIWYVTTDTVPRQLPAAIPYFAVLLALIFGATRLRPPSASGMQYRRGQSE